MRRTLQGAEAKVERKEHDTIKVDKISVSGEVKEVYL